MSLRRKFKGISYYAIYRDMIGSTLRDIKEYVNEASEELSLKQRKLENDFKAAQESASEEDDYDLHSFFEGDSIKYFQVFPLHTYNPMLLVLYGQLEHWLKRICDFHAGLNAIQITADDLSGGDYIEKSRRYLERVAKIEVDKESKAWKRLKMLQNVRNRIAHNNSNVQKTPVKVLSGLELFQDLLKEPYVDLDKETGDFYIKDRHFITDAIELVENYLSEILEKLMSKRAIGKRHMSSDEIAEWGQRKTTALLEMLVESLNHVEKAKSNGLTADVLTALNSRFTTMATDMTEMLSFFYGGQWEESDGEWVIADRDRALADLKEIYS